VETLHLISRKKVTRMTRRSEVSCILIGAPIEGEVSVQLVLLRDCCAIYRTPNIPGASYPLYTR
jgi:hypothetical protein